MMKEEVTAAGQVKAEIGVLSWADKQAKLG
jgi:hypothetical protein